MTILPTALPPWGGLRTARGHLPLVAMDVRAEVAGLFAATRVRQSFANPFDDAIEAAYIFPLPDRAGVTRFVATLGGRRVEGVLKERQAARDDYDEAIAAGRRAAILEEERPGVFTARVGNLLPGEGAEVELELTGPLAYDGGEATYRFPLVVAPRYAPGTPHGGAPVGEGTAVDTDLVPDASRVSPPVLLPGQPNPVRLSLELAVDPLGLEVADLRSTLHAAAVAHDPLRLVLQPGERLDRDVVVRFRLAGAATRTAAVVDGDGTFAVTIVPPEGDGSTGRAPLDVAVVLDRSGSMAGWKMVAARRAAARIVDALTAADQVAVVAFDDRIDRPERLGAGLAPATDENRFAAVEFLSRIEARGGTDVHTAMEGAARQLAAGGHGGVLVLVTDGQVAHEDHVLRTLQPFLGSVRVFTVGIDRAVNAGFLRRLAEATGGRAELVESEDRLDEAMTRIHRAVRPPLVQAVEIRADGITPGTLTPARPPDLFTGAPTVISGRGRPDRITLTGRRPDGAPWTQTVVPREVDNPAVRTVWARAYVRQLEDGYAVAGSPELATLIVNASLTYGVLSRFTAFVAVDASDPTSSTAPRPVVQPVEPPSMWPVAKLTMQPFAAGPATVASPAPPEQQLRELLDRLSETTRRKTVARELDRIAGELAEGDLRDAVTRLAAVLRSRAPWEEVLTAVEKVRLLLGPARARAPFWT